MSGSTDETVARFWILRGGADVEPAQVERYCRKLCTCGVYREFRAGVVRADGRTDQAFQAKRCERYLSDCGWFRLVGNIKPRSEQRAIFDAAILRQIHDLLNRVHGCRIGKVDCGRAGA